MAHDARDRACVNSRTQLSQQLNAETVAEFVESEGVLEQVRKAGITYTQGYHIGRPSRSIPRTDKQPRGQPTETGKYESG